VNQVERIPPQSIETEMIVLGSMLHERIAAVKATEILTAEDFYKDSHRQIFKAITSTIDEVKDIDLISVTNQLAKTGHLEECGGMYYLTELLETVASTALIDQHSKTVKAKAVLRKIIIDTSNAASQCYATDANASIIIDSVEEKMFSYGADVLRKGFVAFNTAVADTLEAQERIQTSGNVMGITTGYRDLDEKIGGFHKTDLVILAARPAMGKTSLMLNMAINATRDDAKVGIVSLEMSQQQLINRIICSESALAYKIMRTRRFTNEEYTRYCHGAARVANKPIFVDDSPGLDILELKAKARRLKYEKDIDILMVDYMQLISARGYGKKLDEITEISGQLRQLAKELNIPILALSQLSRSNENSEDKRPKMHNLRESGAIEQDATSVLFIYREKYYDADSIDQTAEIIISKNRHGQAGTAFLTFLDEIMKFEQAAHPSEQQYTGPGR